jgi:hypothetical protein
MIRLEQSDKKQSNKLFFFFLPNTNKLGVSLASTKRLQTKLFFLGQHKNWRKISLSEARANMRQHEQSLALK